nr:hypothetical protein [Elizabethkingia sp. ASV34]
MENKETWIEGDTLFYRDHGNIENANLHSLQYAYVHILGDVPFLFCFRRSSTLYIYRAEGF